MPQQQQQRNLFEEIRTNAGTAHGLLQAVCATVRPFLSRWGTHGEAFYGRHALLGYFVLMPIYYSLWQGDPKAVGVLYFWVASLVILGVQQAAAQGLRRRGYECHSRYDGVPWLPGKDELAVKGKGQPLLMFVAGFVSLPFSPALGLWLILAAVGLAVDVAAALTRENARVRAMRDARFEYLNVAQRSKRR